MRNSLHNGVGVRLHLCLPGEGKIQNECVTKPESVSSTLRCTDMSSLKHSWSPLMSVWCLDVLERRWSCRDKHSLSRTVGVGALGVLLSTQYYHRLWQAIWQEAFSSALFLPLHSLSLLVVLVCHSVHTLARPASQRPMWRTTFWHYQELSLTVRSQRSCLAFCSQASGPFPNA